MKYIEWLLFRALLLACLFGMFAWAHPVTQLQGNDIKAYVAGANNVGVRACQGLRAGMSAHILSRSANMARVKFGNDAQPPECRNKWAWVPYQYLPQSTWPSGYQSTEAGTCANCNETRPGSGTTAEEIAAIAGGLLNPTNGFQPLPGGAARDCRQFVSPNGELGDYGRRTIAAIRAQDPGNNCFLGGQIPISRHVCPNYRNFSPRQRERFWVYTFASISHDEATCRPNVSGDGGSSDGLFQLEWSNSLRRRNDNNGRNRGPACKPGISWNTRELNFQFNCTASIIKRMLCNRNTDRPLGNGSPSTIFWSQFQRTNGDISNMVRRFPGCN